MNPRRKSRLIGIVSVLVLISAAIGLMLSALKDNIDMFLTPSEVVLGKDGKTPAVGQRIRIGGMVIPGSLERHADNLEVSFSLTDVGPVVRVKYDGLLPDLFREGQGIVATGQLVEKDLLIADEVLAKHDEEYMPPNLAEQMKGIKHVMPHEVNPGGAN